MVTPVRREMPRLGPLVSETIRAMIPVTVRTMPGTLGPISWFFLRVTLVSAQWCVVLSSVGRAAAPGREPCLMPVEPANGPMARCW